MMVSETLSNYSNSRSTQPRTPNSSLSIQSRIQGS